MFRNILAIFRLFKVIREIRTYSQYRGIIKKESQDSPNWMKLKLRYDWIGRIYTVVNLPPEVTMSRDFPVDARPAYVFEEIKPVNEYLTRLNLQEVLTPVLTPIDGTNGDSYLVVYYYFFRQLSWIWLLRIILEFILISLAAYNWSYLMSLIP